MKKIIPMAAVMAFAATSALAADLPSVKAPPAYTPPPIQTWTGFYAGLNAGYTFANSTSTSIATADLGVLGGLPFTSSAAGLFNTNNSGFIGGGQIGYNYQFYNNFLVGIEADIQGIAGSGSTATAWSGGVLPLITATGFSTSASLDYLGTVRGRLGYLITPTILLYGTGGLAYGGVNSSTSIIQPFAGVGVASSAFSDTRVGWTVGGGAEWMFLQNWSAKVEYLYYDLGTIRHSGVLAIPGVIAYGVTQTSHHFDGHVVRAGVNYHFNWGSAPVLAKY